jgi:MoaA/NifB/PqqE/SkfB family radical SAM enzyme
MIRPRSAARVLHARLTQNVPVYAHFGVTHRCGLTCKMCGIWRYGNRAEELTLDQIEEMARKLRRIDVAQLSIGGGEPFEREDLADIVRIFVRHGLEVRVLTNGVTTDPAQLDAVIDAGCRQFSVSLDTLVPDRYDFICEQPQSWERGVKTMLRIAERTLPLGGMPTINTVVSNLNLGELPDIVRFAEAMGFTASLLPVELVEGSLTAAARDWEKRFIRYQKDMALDDDPARVAERVDAAYDAVIAMKNRGAAVLNSTPYLEASRAYLKTGRMPIDGCHAGRLYFSIAPNGQFTICHRKAYQHLSFLDPGFEDYFRSARYEAARSVEAGACEGCIRACWIDTSYMLTTLRGFAETAFQSVRPKRPAVTTWEEAQGWARHDAAVPGATRSAAK